MSALQARVGKSKRTSRLEELSEREEAAADSEAMLSDDIDAPYPPVDPWPAAGSDVVCAMDAVDGMVGIKYSMYGAYDFSGTLSSNQDLKNCQRTGCVPLVRPMTVSPWKFVRGERDCQSIADDRSHPHFAYGKEQGNNVCYTFPKCDVSGRTPKAGFTIYSKPQEWGMLDGGPVAVSCAGEAIIKAEVSRQLQQMPHPTQEPTHHPANGRWRPQATALRAMFHDAHDFNSLLAVDKDTGKWERIDTEEGDYAGVDGCIYDNAKAEPAGGHENFKTLSTDNQGSMMYNQHIERLGQNQDFVRIDKLDFKFVREACFNLCCSTSSKLSEADKKVLCGEGGCTWGRYKDKCSVDVMTLGSLLIIEGVGGPSVPMTWGRRQGDCRNPFKKTTVPGNLDTRRLAKAGASLSSFGKPDDVFSDFARLRMNKTEATALMGAHSYGKLHYYTGGPRTRDRGGGFCTDLGRVQGFFGADGSTIDRMADASTHLDQWSSPLGTCQKGEQTGQGALSCWTTERGYLEPSRGVSAKDKIDRRFLRSFLRKTNGDEDLALKVMVTPSWGGGGFWDTTPDRLDNEYFKMLNATDPRERQQCCGPATPYGCATDGEPMQDKSGRTISGCDVNWCMRSIGEDWLGSGKPQRDSLFPDYALLSTKKFVQARLDTGNAHIGVHHLYRLAADWALIEDAEARAAVARFAKDGAAFNKAFGAAWSKLIELGHAKGALKTCVA